MNGTIENIRFNMCGICGILNFDKTHKVDEELIRKMTHKMIHRGPDGEGFYFDNNFGFGHRRLSIIDIDGGKQPMSNEDETVWIVQNGEIYNYLELAALLRKKDHKLKTHSDTEVIIHLYEEYGVDCVKHLNGMFSFVIWDSKRKKIFAARDRIGIKPFYYFLNSQKFIFASEIKAILCDDTIARIPNKAAIAQYLSRMYTIDDSTFFKSINKLMPGHYLVLENGNTSIKQYWDVEFGEQFNDNEENIISSLRELLEDSVRIHLRSDVPVGAHLSGGLDSSSIVALALSNSDKQLKTFSGAFEVEGNFDERRYIKLIKDKYRTDHYEVLPTAQQYAQMLPKMIWFMDEPSIGSAVLCHYFLSDLVSKHVKVVLGGQGGDEIFGGYYRYIAGYMKDFAKKIIQRQLDMTDVVKTLRNITRYFRVVGINNSLSKAKRRKGLLSITNPEFFKDVAIENAVMKPEGSLNDMLYWDMKYYLPGLLQIEDRTSMAVSIESRIPLLDYRLVEFMAKVPSHIKMKNLILKHMEREAMRDILPKEIVDREDKMGFYAPIYVWFRRDLKQYVENIIFSNSFKERSIFDMQKVRDRYKSYIEGGPDFSEQLWMLINVELWHRIFIDREKIKI